MRLVAFKGVRCDNADLPFQAVHSPDQVPESYKAAYNFTPMEGVGAQARNTFAGMLTCLDEGIGNVTAALQQAGLFEETLIWFQTDNGAATPACGGSTGAQNWPLRGGKCTGLPCLPACPAGICSLVLLSIMANSHMVPCLPSPSSLTILHLSCSAAWEGGLRGTAIISGAGIASSRRGAIEAGLMHTTDVLPTLLAALGLDAFKRAGELGVESLDGFDQWPLISQGTTPAPREEVLLECDPFADPWSNRPPDFVCNGDQHATPYYALRRGQWKLILGDPGDDGGAGSLQGIGNGWYCTGPPCPSDHNNSNSTGPSFPVDTVQLFDVEADPMETIDRSADYPEVVDDLTSCILAYNATAVDSSGVCLPADPRQDPALHNHTCWPYSPN